jgi:DNA-binding MarR family transcriptional regulator
MSAIDTAKEIARIAVTSGLSNEIIELLEKKISLLTEQIATLEREKSSLVSDNTNLQKKIEDLEQQLASLSPQSSGLDQVSLKFLKLLFDRDELSVEDVAASLGISKGLAEYHCDILSKANMIKPIRIGVEDFLGSSPATYGLLPKGREYVIKNS